MRMRITESQLRRIIREALLSEVPLGDIIPHDIPPSERRRDSGKGMPWRDRPSIAHPASRSQDEKHAGGGYLEIAKDLMLTARDNWVIITPDDYTDNRSKGKDFIEWLDSKRKQYPPDTIFAFVGQGSYPDDARTPEWNIVHDLFGHTLEQVYQRRPSRPPLVKGEDITVALHRALPGRYRISTDSRDQVPDILAAILLEVLTPEAAHRVIEESFGDRSPEETAYAHSEVDLMFKAVESWLTEARRKRIVDLVPW